MRGDEMRGEKRRGDLNLESHPYLVPTLVYGYS